MKLFVAATVAASVTASDPAPACTDATPLFDVACNAETATMTVTVDETCRASEYRNVFFRRQILVTDFVIRILSPNASTLLKKT